MKGQDQYLLLPSEDQDIETKEDGVNTKKLAGLFRGIRAKLSPSTSRKYKRQPSWELISDSEIEEVAAAN